MCVVGGYGTVTKVEALAKVQTALTAVSGFIDAFAIGDAPKVAFARFSNVSAMTTFVREQKSVESFSGLWAARQKPLEVRKVQRALNKVKRGICEVVGASSPFFKKF